MMDQVYPREALEHKRAGFEQGIKTIAVERFGYSVNDNTFYMLIERNRNGRYAVEWVRGAWEGLMLAEQLQSSALAAGMGPKALQINFPAAERANVSDSKLYSHAEVPSMDRADEDYIVHLTVRGADPDQERLLADTCTRAVTSAPKALAAMHQAYAKLDSVAFVSVEGDTDEVKTALLDAMAALTVQ